MFLLPAGNKIVNTYSVFTAYTYLEVDTLHSVTWGFISTNSVFKLKMECYLTARKDFISKYYSGLQVVH